jgi:hypothetical protein
MPCAYYIYYRVDPAKAAACEPLVRELINTLGQTIGVTGRLMTKRGEGNLWMEVYDNVADDACFEQELAAAVAKLRIEACLQAGGTRRMECFREA